MSESKSNFQDSYISNNKDNKFSVIADDTKDCCEHKACRPQVVQGYPVQQIFIDLSDCRKQDMCKKEEK